LCLIVFVILAAGCLFGEEFESRKIKHEPRAAGLLMLGCMGVILCGLQPFLPASSPGPARFPNEWTGRRSTVMPFR